MRSKVLGIALGLGLALSTGAARAQDAVPGSVKGVTVVVELRGKRRHGADRLSRTLRRKLADALGGLRSSRALHREQDRLEIPKKERTKPSRLAIAGKGVNAEYLVFVRVARKRRARYEAKGYLIETETAKIIAKHTEKYRRPSKEAGPAGERLAIAMLVAIGKLKASEAPPAEPPPIAAAPEPPPLPETPTAPPPNPAEPTPAPPPTEPAIAAAPPPSFAPPRRAPTPPPSIETPAPKRRPRRGVAEVRVAVGAGAGLVRSYDISAEAVQVSDLSHSLSPQGMARLVAEVELTKIGLGLSVQGSLRPVGYQVVVDSETRELSGMLLDAQAALRYHLALTERAGLPVQLLPALGVRLSRSGVESHSPAVIPNATLISPFARVGARLPYDEQLELEGGVDFGLAAGYAESPVDSGESPGGFSFGADVGLRYWFGARFGVAFDTRFTMDKLSFSNQPTRAVTRNEQAGLLDVNLSIIDVRSALSMLIRL